MVLRLLLLLLVRVVTGAASNAVYSQNAAENLDAKADVTLAALKPYIHYCRSPNMETFTCWWRLPDNSYLNNINFTYALTYIVGKGPKQDCPDYVTGGPNSCFFDSRHTQVWEVYCMNVTARSGHGTFTSKEHCLDVADIVETDPPFNLTYQLSSSTEEPGRTVSVSWQYPIAADVQMGWVTLVYELQFRRKSEPHNWKVKGVLREPHLELLDLPVGSYVVRVRCKSHNSGLWSRWSTSLTVNVPTRRAIAVPDRMLALILVMGLGGLAFIIISIGIIPQGQRIKAFFLPPIPKPRIKEIDPMLLKNGKLDEINRLFSSFHDYTAPQSSEETWLQVSIDEDLPVRKTLLTHGALEEDRGCQHLLQKLEGSTQEECSTAIPPADRSVVAPPGPCPAQTELLTLPDLGYSLVLSSNPAPPFSQDFYSWVNAVGARGDVHLVPCPPKHTPYLGEGPADCCKKGQPERAIKDGQVEAAAREAAVRGGMAGGDSNTSVGDTGLRKELCVATPSDPRRPTTAPPPGDPFRAASPPQDSPYVSVASREETSVYGLHGFRCSEQNELRVPLLPAITRSM